MSSTIDISVQHPPPSTGNPKCTMYASDCQPVPHTELVRCSAEHWIVRCRTSGRMTDVKLGSMFDNRLPILIEQISGRYFPPRDAYCGRISTRFPRSVWIISRQANRMEVREIAESARKTAVMVRVRGPDPKGLKMRGHAFHLRENGITSLSASGFLLSDSLADSLPSFGTVGGNGGVVVTSASVVESFLIAKYRDGSAHEKFMPELIPGAIIDVLLDRCILNQKSGLESPSWHPAQLLSIVDVAASSDALKVLVKSNRNSTDSGSWDLGWTLAPPNNIENINRSESIQLQKEIPVSMSVAFLRIPEIDTKDYPPVNVSKEQRKGEFLLAVGSPFGILSPSHFLNSVSVGAVANFFPRSSCGSLLVADIRCLPGMEGGPVFDRNESLIGIISKPLRKKNSNVEIQVIITWDSVYASCWELKKQKLPKDVDEKSTTKSTTSLEKATSSVVLITVGNDSWASGIIINDHGLILTNAHLIEPWRFPKQEELGFPSSDSSPFQDSGYKGYTRTRVRLNHQDPFVWCDASVVYVSKGPLDVALLKLDSLPLKLEVAVPDIVCPSEGLRVHAIGHGPLGPSSEIHPFVSSGVVTKVVNSKLPKIEIYTGHEQSKVPVMLQTTASVYPGMSGGAVVNALNGQMVALITSNVRHAGGSTIPHLNFSIPCAALKPIFDFAENEGDKGILDVLDRPDALLSSIWALVPPPQPLEDLKLKKEKGFRFAKFLEERAEKTSISSKL